MSGHKRATITINEDEYDRLREAEAKLRTLPEVPEQNYAAIIEQGNKAMHSHIQKMEKRQSSLELILSGMDQYVRDLETSTVQHLREYEKQSTQAAQAYAGDLWNSFNQVLQQQNTRFEAQIAAAHQAYQDELSVYSRRIRRMADDLESKRVIAENWLATAEQFSQFIDQNYPHETFVPGKLIQLSRQLAQARDNLNIGLSEAVIVTSQQLYYAFSDFRVDLERYQQEWSLLLQTAWEAVGQVLTLAQQSRVVTALDLDGNALEFEIDVDYWSQGRLGQLIDELAYIKGILESEVGLPNTETLQRWLNLDLPVYYQALEDIVLDARISALNSQLRINIADLVVRALRDQGYALDESSYDAADQRSSYEARLSSIDGSAILVQVEPTGHEIGQNELHVQSMDQQDRTEHELQQRWYEVSRSLSRYGLSVGQYIREDTPAYNGSIRRDSPTHDSREKQKINNSKNNLAS